MIEDVRSAFADAVQELDWMDTTTRLKTLSKLKAIRNFVGFPAWLLTNDQLDKHYKHVSFTNNACCLPKTDHPATTSLIFLIFTL